MIATLWSGLRLLIAAAVAILLGGLAGAYAGDGVTANTVIFGQAAALEGPASALGAGMQRRG